MSELKTSMTYRLRYMQEVYIKNGRELVGGEVTTLQQHTTHPYPTFQSANVAAKRLAGGICTEAGIDGGEVLSFGASGPIEIIDANGRIVKEVTNE